MQLQLAQFTYMSKELLTFSYVEHVGLSQVDV